jgi:hypothetical protein
VTTSTVKKAAYLAQDANEFIKSLKSFHQAETEIETDEEEDEDNPVSTPVHFNFSGFWPERTQQDKHVFVGFIQQFYNQNRRLPQESDFKLNFLEEELPEDWVEFFEEIQPLLEARGIPCYEPPVGILDPQFVTAVGLLCDPMDKRSSQAKLKDAQLTKRQFNALLRVPEYHDYYEMCVNEIFNQDTRLAAKRELAKQVENGDLQAIKHFHELTNTIRPQLDQMQQFMAIIQAVMEILSRHVPPDVLTRVAAEIRDATVIEVKELT